MSEQRIFRPNSFTPEQWDELPRKQQVQWWKDQEQKGRDPQPLRAVSLYRRGVITKSAVPTAVFGSLTTKNVAEFIAGCPTDIMQLLRDSADELPADGDDQAWAKLICIFGGSYHPWVTQEEIEAARRDGNRRFREGVQIFRGATSG